jgi:hypothetical protein
MRATLMAMAPVVATVVAACAGALQVPEALHTAGAPALVVAARGEQIYECRPGKTAGTHEWVFVAPEAALYDARGRTVGHHGAGPSWQATDGSRVVGTVKARADAPARDAIPWLLLDARSEGGGGTFGGVTRIQRVNTAGGLAPSAGCDATAAGTQARIGYTADYRMFTRG